MASATVFRKDYIPPTHWVDSVYLEFDLHPQQTHVHSTLMIRPNEDRINNDLVLNGRDLDLIRIAIDGRELDRSEYTILPTGDIVLRGITENIKLEIENVINPQANSSLMGLYLSNGNFMTQCEAEGFRRITYYPDRPDVSAKFTVRINAPKSVCPVLLSNGNLIEEGELDGNWHYTCWEDPFPKPSYLFALVAGNLKCREEKFQLKNGKKALLQIWVEPRNLDKTEFALESLKRAIAWDEERFGLELDLERFMIVATDDFTMGAMENKGLNIFNSRCVLATPQVATDRDFARIESVIGHEYFHNWTGDRVTCRDWFQLTLKEGLTVFREQEFAADMLGDSTARAVKRIEDVRYLRDRQFPEDAGPMAHPIRPESYEEINNFYTTTVYEKGAEVIRMLQTLLGKDGFKRGLDLYIREHDGSCATCEDFLNAMAEANMRNLNQFKRWYSQAGTPHVRVRTHWDAQSATYAVTLTQFCPPSPGQDKKEPFFIPFDIALFNSKGTPIALQLQEETTAKGTSRVLELTDEEHTWVFVGVKEQPIPSLARNFSAPIIVDYNYTPEELVFLSQCDNDAFNRAQAMEELSLLCINEMVADFERGTRMVINPHYRNAFESMLTDKSVSPAFKAIALTLPSETRIAESQPMINPIAIRAAIRSLREQLGRQFSHVIMRVFDDNAPNPVYSPSAAEAGKRAMRAFCFELLLAGGNAKSLLRARQIFETSKNLTERLDALRIIVNSASPTKFTLLEAAEAEWRKEPLLINKWFTLQATATVPMDECPIVDVVQNLIERYPGYNVHNPNNVYSLVLAFCQNNLAEFHRPDGAGYKLWVEQVLKLDRINPQVSSRLARCLDNWRRYTPECSKLMFSALKYVYSQPNLSSDLKEVVGKALNNATH
ncbi:aminopeptidase N [Parasutterella secunda]|uniref:aminopeptidase N n=1 Tax=Parasutterella secunda TaxID=626947 RepID=UPI000340057E|nr:aminopeptidase N [Parasutterella secunda]CDE76597.1 aminopeptidase N (Alpha-aminoacylpeptide hydrolase) [Sutterella sp. CAG:521]HIR21913.1 aminopeptidase N [Candidatus Aphodousia faecalis]HJI93742.1 aminopeptidase N [Sutterellaceae bacterium]MCL1595803.1 aminopeptidase N [Parasutterella secunda]MDM8087153.1 aminopeptidase N [Parasutterella secunda]